MISPRNIDPHSGSGKANLDESLLEILSQVGSLRTDLEGIQEELTSIISSSDSSITSINNIATELSEARLGAASLKEKLIELQDRQLQVTSQRLSYTKTIEKTDGKVSKEVYSGDIEQEIRFSYDQNGDLLAKVLFVNGLEIGRIDYSKDLNNNDVETHVTFDIYNIGSDSITLNSIVSRLMSIENLNVAQRLDNLDAKTASGNYDGTLVMNKLQTVENKVTTLESVAFENITEIINLPQWTARIQALEFESDTPFMVDEFEFEGPMSLSLSGIVAHEIEVTCDGLEFVLGESDDYVLSLDKQSVILLTRPITGSKIRCKYY